MATDVGRFSMSAEKYIEQHHVLIYLEDAISQLLQHKEDNAKVNPSKFFSDYFASVKEGNHTLFREYSYVKATPHNRESFISTFWKCFRNIGKNGDLLNSTEYHSLICLICADFPFSIVEKTARIILTDDATDCLISFPDFLYAFQIQFCYDEFLIECADIYKELIKSPPVALPETVVVPTSETADDSSSVHSTVEQEAVPDGVDAVKYFRALSTLCEKTNISTPPVSVLRQLLCSVSRVTFYGFLVSMAKSESLNASIGKLPPKSELLDNEPEIAGQSSNCKLESDPADQQPKSRPTSSLRNRPVSASPQSSTNITPKQSEKPQGPKSKHKQKPIEKEIVLDSITNVQPLSQVEIKTQDAKIVADGGRGDQRPQSTTRRTIARHPDMDVDDDDDDDDDVDTDDSGSTLD